MSRRPFSLSLLSLMVSSVWSLQCLDPSSKFVDWYATYKAPELREGPGILKTGLAQYYLDVNSPTWALSKHLINETGSAVYSTLQQIYSSQSKSIFYIMYNDEKPQGSKADGGGHTKGVVGFDGKSGFWLIHSVPKFPPCKKDGFSYPNTGKRFGQSFLCISLPYKMLGLVGKQLLYNEPHIHDYRAPQSMLKDFPILKDVLKKRQPMPGPPYYNILTLQSTQGQNFTSFAKTTKFEKDLYTELVAPVLKDSMLVETWMNGGGQLATNCSGEYKIYNVVHVSLPDDVLFKRSHDHSKWATGFTAQEKSNAGLYWTCIGDINRMYGQYKRGGGTVCINNQGVWKTFRQSVEKYEKCNRELV